MNCLSRPTKRCSNCRREFDLIFFRRVHVKGASADAHKICKGCEQTGRDQKKRENPFLAKAYSAIRDHAHRLGFSVDQMRNDFGWIATDIAHQMEHAYANGCKRCHKLYLSMGHGLADLTVDIVNPQMSPFWCNNTQFLCNTCNQEKSDLSPEDDAIMVREWQRWEADPWPEDPQSDMFDPINIDGQRQKIVWQQFKTAPFPGSAIPLKQGILWF